MDLIQVIRNIEAVKRQRADAFYRRDRKMVDDLDQRIAGLTALRNRLREQENDGWKCFYQSV